MASGGEEACIKIMTLNFPFPFFFFFFEGVLLYQENYPLLVGKLESFFQELEGTLDVIKWGVDK